MSKGSKRRPEDPKKITKHWAEIDWHRQTPKCPQCKHSGNMIYHDSIRKWVCHSTHRI